MLNVAGTLGMLEAQDNGDYDWVADEYKAIKIVYPEECYACAQYATTKRLLHLAEVVKRTFGELTEERFKVEIQNEYEI